MRVLSCTKNLVAHGTYNYLLLQLIFPSSVGSIDPHKTRFERQSSIVICRVEHACSLMIQPRDLFDNLCLTASSISFESDKYVDLESYSSIVKQVNVIL